MNTTIIGAQLGDEGKGALVDLLSDTADIVVRYQGGANAGHTVVAQGDEYHLRLIPSGVVQGSTGVIGAGCVVNVETLFDELDELRAQDLSPDVRVDARAHVVMPYHQVLDDAEETTKDDERTVGTTGNGIGPAYEDKVGRRGIRIGDLLSPDHLQSHLQDVVPRKRRLATDILGIDTGIAFDVDNLVELLHGFGERLKAENSVIDAGTYLNNRSQEGDTILFESAQGTYLDIDHGNYPFVTSSNPTAGGAITGAGVPPDLVSDGVIIGVTKAYLSRVGNGPMPTELDEDAAGGFREYVDGFGTNTNRPRRIGWLDLPMVRHAARVNGFTAIALNHVDALSWFDEVKVCTAYDLDGDRITSTPPTTKAWERCTPIYETLDGWPSQRWGKLAVDGFEALPPKVQTFVRFVSNELDLPVYSVGVGPAREETIIRDSLTGLKQPPKP